MSFPGAFCFEETDMKIICALLLVIYGSDFALGLNARSAVETASKSRAARIEAAIETAIR